MITGRYCVITLSHVYSLFHAFIAFLCMASGSFAEYAYSVHVSVRDASNGTKLEFVRVSPTAGYIQTPGWSYLTSHPQIMDSVIRVEVPARHRVMITMLHLNLTGHKYYCRTSNVRLILYKISMQKSNTLWRCGRNLPMLRKQLPKGAHLYVHFQSFESPMSGFKLFASVHNESTLLRQRTPGLWNCSVPFFVDFKTHFPCDLTPQCVNKEDERDCPYFSEDCGLGFITMRERCVFYGMKVANSSWRDMEFWCSKRGGMLMNLRTPDDYGRVLRYVQPLVDVWGFHRIVVGLHSASRSLPVMYRNEFQHTDKVIAFYRSSRKQLHVDFTCGSLFLSDDRAVLSYLTLGYCTKVMSSPSVLCEIPKKHSPSGRNVYPVNTVKLQSVSNLNSSRLRLLGCPLGHVTRDFLACDFASKCLARDLKSCLAPLTPLPPSFSCANGFESVPYTLVCDVRPDCSDGSDESFCEFPPCDLPEPFHCSDRECVLRSAVCNGQKNCYNGIDEDLCSIKDIGFTFRPSPPAIVHLNRKGHFTVRKLTHLQIADLSPETCPETHFQCQDNGYCMPVFLRCNGVYDCLGQEDEADCPSYACPDFYRCRGSQVCLHPQHLCDGIFQCPQDDDELLCKQECPENCICYGLAFYCVEPFQANNFTKLRFLDGRGTGMKPYDLTANVMLVYLNMAANGMTAVGKLKFPNLRTLDLSDNKLKEIHLNDLKHLPQLETLSLSGNPLLLLFQSAGRPDTTNSSPGDSRVTHQLSSDSSGWRHVTFHTASDRKTVTYIPETSSVVSSYNTLYTVTKSVRALDLSRVKVKVLNLSFLSLLPNLRTVNMSGCGVDTLLGGGFQALTQLRELDLRGCPLTNVPSDVFRGLEELETVYSDNYKLCCPAMLPNGFVPKKCHAPYDEISSCEALLRSNSYRVFLSIFTTLTILGNSCSFVYRVFVEKSSKLLSFDIFVTHLSVADFLMGVYLGMIGIADRLYKGTYLWEDNAWKKGTSCHMAGFLSLVSSEVSAFIICLITIDRFLVLRFPFSTFHFGTRSAQVASLCAWGIGCLIATVPLIRGVDHWQFYSQTGICIPLPVSRRNFPGYNYAFGVMIVANFVFFIVIAAGQAFVYWSVRINSLSLGEKSRKSQDVVVARRLITVAMSDFLCWFPIGLVGTIAATGTPISSEVNVAMAIFVLPFNSALNPFLYTINIVLEKRRRSQEEKIKERLMAQFRSLDIEEKTMSIRRVLAS